MIENRVSTLMGERRLKITQLAEGAQISYATAYSLYQDRNKMIRYDVLDRLCEFFDCQPGDILVHVPEDSTGERKEHEELSYR